MNNRIEELSGYLQPGRHIHLIGIGGVSMRPLGLVLQGMGMIVTGSDMSLSASTQELTEKGLCVDALDALTLAEKAGSSKAVNIVLMGKAAKYFDIPYKNWITAIENTVAPKFIEMNKTAFDLGYNS